MSYVFKKAKYARYSYRVHLAKPGELVPVCHVAEACKGEQWKWTSGPVTCRRCWEKMGWDGQTPELKLE